MRSIRDFLRDRRASVSLRGAPITLVIVAVTLAIGVYILANIQPSIKGLTGTANTTVTNIFTQAYSAFGLLVVGLLVLAAVAILVIIRYLAAAR
ncbi:MAG: hypothetical protein DRO12_03735 [Thermoprotei archaeon]|nr:MAG: hypothetical protein DRO12_03735 [Thermoprotei archaeon]